MKKPFVLTLVFVSSVTPFATPSARAQDPAKAAVVAPPAAAPKKVDRTNVKAVVQAFGAAVATGDKATARSLVSGTAKQLEYVEAMIDDYQAIIRFDKALKAKFRGDADDYLDYYERYGELSKKAQIEIDEDDEATATFEVPDKDFEEEWYLVKRNGQWGLDANQFWDPKEEADVSPEQLRQSTKAVDAVTKRLAAGAFSSVEDAIEAFDGTQDLSKFRKD